MNHIKSFTGKNGFLSNFYPCEVEMEGELYPSVEHAFQAAKTLDAAERVKFQGKDVKPATAKRWGRKIQLRQDWEDVKVPIMHRLVYDKFTRGSEPGQPSDLQRMLLATGDVRLEEGNRHGDRFWGTVNGEGQNMLGKVLMEVRGQIRDEQGEIPHFE